MQTGSVQRDVCVLSIAPARFDVPVARLRASTQLRTGDAVVAVSFAGGRRTPLVSEGAVEGVYAYDGGDVVRTSAAFDFGSSGGALMDSGGRVVGLLAFKSAAGDLRYAVPSEWIGDALTMPSVPFPLDPTVPAVAFWERSWLDRPTFLATGR
jgi:S1-C subfamily serine protease